MYDHMYICMTLRLLLDFSIFLMHIYTYILMYIDAHIYFMDFLYTIRCVIFTKINIYFYNSLIASAGCDGNLFLFHFNMFEYKTFENYGIKPIITCVSFYLLSFHCI